MNINKAMRIVGKLMNGDEYTRFRLAEEITKRIYPRYKFAEFGRLYLYDQPFLDLYTGLIGNEDYHRLDRMFTLDQLMVQVYYVAGDTVECGVYQGATSYIMCRRLIGSGKKHHVFDSFAGLSHSDERDGTYWTQGDLAASETVVRKTLEPFDFVNYHAGWIPEKFPEVAALRFSFVHIDVDLYQPTEDSVRFFYERLQPGGILLCDDYGFATCPGAKQAMDTFFADKPERIVHLPTGQGFITKLASLST